MRRRYFDEGEDGRLVDCQLVDLGGHVHHGAYFLVVGSVDHLVALRSFVHEDFPGIIRIHYEELCRCRMFVDSILQDFAVLCPYEKRFSFDSHANFLVA